MVLGGLHALSCPEEVRPHADVLVIADDMDLPFGRLRLRPFGGHGGHNGLRSAIATIGDRFPRLRVGVSRPELVVALRRRAPKSHWHATALGMLGDFDWLAQQPPVVANSHRSKLLEPMVMKLAVSYFTGDRLPCQATTLKGEWLVGAVQKRPPNFFTSS